ncbi:metal dependent phosphohydrolase [Stanieria cyanosphaera PCC 7437]|uniref:Metal dependent phosphohydrolase n=1 Tax=Stanieria cyanosphaera (strain ATCC 29371 / PCC 7437) TaxID=111780 RepID=K9XY99_STAC7|nr:HD domain-containing protein [Stanieria cyanosphaera]AFZ37513.1 metal dependent phosphohydrolase [Stanieria cyanosphaera PCC 7437]
MTLNPEKTTKLSNRFEQALVYATRLHAQQVRKGSGVPYISHLLSVAALVIEDGGDEDEAIAALLHDAIEDQGGDKTRQEIREKFGETVVNIVNACTDAEVIPKPPWQARKQNYIEKMRHASPQVRRVSMADKLHNARSILADWHRGENDIWSRFTGGREGTLWYYRSLIEVNRQAGSNFLTEECGRVVKQLEQI